MAKKKDNESVVTANIADVERVAGLKPGALGIPMSSDGMYIVTMADGDGSEQVIMVLQIVSSPLPGRLPPMTVVSTFGLDKAKEVLRSLAQAIKVAEGLPAARAAAADGEAVN